MMGGTTGEALELAAAENPMVLSAMLIKSRALACVRS